MFKTHKATTALPEQQGLETPQTGSLKQQVNCQHWNNMLDIWNMDFAFMK
jgi:hypothetical protein